MQAVEVRESRKTYPGGVEAVKGIDFDVEAGEAFGLLAPHGAGKSATIGMLTTTITPTAGSARLAGHDVSCWRVYARVTSEGASLCEEGLLLGAYAGCPATRRRRAPRRAAGDAGSRARRLPDAIPGQAVPGRGGPTARRHHRRVEEERDEAQ